MAGKTAKGISKVINKLHGIDKPEPLQEGKGYSTEGAGTEIKKTPQTKESKKEKPNELVIWDLLSKGKFEEALKLVDNNLSLLSSDQKEIIDEWRKIQQEKKRLEIQQEIRKEYGVTEEDVQRRNNILSQRAQLEKMGETFASNSGPIVSNLLSGVAKPNPARQQSQNNQSLFGVPNTKQTQESSTVDTKKDPERTKIGQGPVKEVQVGDGEADILAKMYNLMQEQQSFQNKKTRDEKKYQREVNKEKENALEETIESVSAVSNIKPSKISKKKNLKSSSGKIKKSRSPRFLQNIYGIAVIGGDILLNTNWKEKFEKTFKDAMKDFNLDFKTAEEKNYTKDITGARKSIEDYIGRQISDKEFDELIRATSAEAGAKSNKTEESMIMATILNRARDSGKTITDVLNQPNQFQAVTGTKLKPGPSERYTKGPSSERKEDIISGATTILPQVSKKQKRFTAESEAAYGPGTNIGYREELKKSGGDVVGGTRFETKAPTSTSTNLAKIMPKDITSSFGKRMLGGVTEEHGGVDIKGNLHDPVVSAKDGKVSTVGYQEGGYGTYIEVDHGNGFKTRYAHLSKTDVKVGDVVSTGQKIGEVGATGHVTGPHLHYELLKDGQKVDVTKSESFNLNPVVPDYKLSSADKTYSETRDMKKDMKVADASSGLNIVNNTTNVIKPATTYAMGEENEYSYPPLLKKQYNYVD